MFPFLLTGKKYFLGALYNDCLNPGQLKRQIALIKEEMERIFINEPIPKKAIMSTREGYLFQDISDAEIDRIFSLGGI